MKYLSWSLDSLKRFNSMANGNSIRGCGDVWEWCGCAELCIEVWKKDMYTTYSCFQRWVWEWFPITVRLWPKVPLDTFSFSLTSEYAYFFRWMRITTLAQSHENDTPMDTPPSEYWSLPTILKRWSLFSQICLYPSRRTFNSERKNTSVRRAQFIHLSSELV